MQKSHHLWIRLIAALMLLNTLAIANTPASSNDAISIDDATSTNGAKPTNDAISYSCGNVEFSKKAVSQAIAAGLKKYYNFEASPLLYHGPLFDSKTISFAMFPIRVDINAPATKQNYDYFVVFGWSSGQVAVIARAPDGDKICGIKRAGSSSPPPFISYPISSNSHKSTHTPNNDVGFKCGQKFIGNVIIAIAVILAKLQTRLKCVDYVIKNTNPLCIPTHHCLLWPVYQGDNTHGSVNNGGLRLFILTDQSGNLKHVVASFPGNGGFETCMPVHNTKGGQLNPSRIEQESEVEPGFQCGKIFFGNRHLVSQAKEAKKADSNRKLMNARGVIYPKKHTGEPFLTEVLLWPVHPDKEYSRARASQWFLVMDKAFKPICVAVFQHNISKCCETRLVDTGEEEEDDFKCRKFIRFSNQQMVEAKEGACKKPKSPSSKFPAIYHGPKFDVPGPYLTWPILRSGLFTKNSSRFRIVINHNCRLAGVLMKSLKGRLVKCQRSKDNSTPGGVSNEEIYEGEIPTNQQKHHISSSQTGSN